MSGPLPDGPVTAADVAVRVRAVLDRVGYGESQILRLLGLTSWPSFRQRGEALPLYLWRTREGTPLDVLVRLFLLQQPVALDAVCRAIAPMHPDEWASVGLLRRDGNEVRATVELCAYQGVVATADWPGAAATVPQPVMEIAASSRALASMTVRRPVGRALDLGTGCGVLAFLAAAHSNQVVAVDCNPRAVELARFNARLNGLTNVECREGDLFEPVRGQTFDLIVCNPPFVIAPGAGLQHTFSGRPADQLCREIARTAPEFLNEGGYCQMVCNWAVVAGQDWRERLAEWCTGTGCDAWVLHSHAEDADAYALQRIREATEDPNHVAPAFDEWMAYYRRERIEAVGFGLITLRRSGRSAPWFRCDGLSEFAATSGRAIEQGFARRDFLESHRDDAALLRSRVRAAGQLRWELERDVSSGDLTVLSSRLRSVDGLSCVGEADADVVNFVARCAGDRPLGDHLSEVAAAAGRDVQRLAPPFLGVVRRLIELGVLVPADGV